MRNVFIFSLLALSCLVISCSADAIPTHAESNQDIGGQSGTIPPPPPTKP